VKATILRQLGLLAERPDWERLGDHFRRGPTDFNSYNLLAVIAIAAAFVLGIFLLQRFAQRRDHSKSYTSPTELFRELCRAHRLDRSERRLLKRLAAAWGLARPAYLFIEPDYFDTAGLPVEWQEDSHRVASIRERLFGAS
jgi:hypothetical protein